MDGVVIDSVPYWRIATVEMLDKRGIDISKFSGPNCSGKSQLEAAQILTKYYYLDDDPKKFAQERIKRVSELYNQQLTYQQGFIDFYNELNKRKFKCCIATSSDDYLINTVDGKLELNKYFHKNIFKISDVSYKSKPKPDVFNYAIRKVNSSPEECMVIEDTPDGIEAAKRAGTYCVGITTSHLKKTLHKADFVVNSFKEINLDYIELLLL